MQCLEDPASASDSKAKPLIFVEACLCILKLPTRSCGQVLHASSLSLKRVILIQEASGKSLYQAFVTTVSRDLFAQFW